MSMALNCCFPGWQALCTVNKTDVHAREANNNLAPGKEVTAQTMSMSAHLAEAIAA